MNMNKIINNKINIKYPNGGMADTIVSKTIVFGRVGSNPT